MKRTLILAFLGIALAVSAVAFDKTPNAATEPLANILGFHKDYVKFSSQFRF